MVVSESLKLFNIEEILSKYRIGNVELERMFEGIDFLDKFQLTYPFLALMVFHKHSPDVLHTYLFTSIKLWVLIKYP